MEVDRRHPNAFPDACHRVQRAKAHLVSSGGTLTPSGGRLLDELLRLGPEFRASDVAAADADPAVRDGAAYLLDFLCEIGILREHAGSPRTYVRNADRVLAGSVACVVCGGDWPIDDAALAALRRSICLAPNFLVVLHTLKVVGICPACRVT